MNKQKQKTKRTFFLGEPGAGEFGVETMGMTASRSTSISEAGNMLGSEINQFFESSSTSGQAQDSKSPMRLFGGGTGPGPLSEPPGAKLPPTTDPVGALGTKLPAAADGTGGTAEGPSDRSFGGVLAP